jgi:hypothetical protein
MSKTEAPLPADVERRYEGRWIAWDTTDQQVVGSGDTADEAVQKASPVSRQTGHLIWYRHIAPANSVIVGGL